MRNRVLVDGIDDAIYRLFGANWICVILVVIMGNMYRLYDFGMHGEKFLLRQITVIFDCKCGTDSYYYDDYYNF